LNSLARRRNLYTGRDPGRELEIALLPLLTSDPVNREMLYELDWKLGDLPKDAIIRVLGELRRPPKDW
jgi:hypothetical protein